MDDSSKDNTSDIIEEALNEPFLENLEENPKNTYEPKYILQLYVTGNTIRSSQAIKSIKKLCQEYLEGRYKLEVIDIFQQPARAKEAQIIAAPTLIRQLPRPMRKFVGDMTDEKKVLIGLGISYKDSAK